MSFPLADWRDGLWWTVCTQTTTQTTTQVVVDGVYTDYYHRVVVDGMYTDYYHRVVVDGVYTDYNTDYNTGL